MDFSITDMYPEMNGIFATFDQTIPDDKEMEALVTDESQTAAHKVVPHKIQIWVGIFLLLAGAIFFTSI